MLGEQFAVAIAASVIDEPVIACMPSFEEARDSGLLEPTATVGEWRFGHGLVRDAVEAGLPIAEKADLHRMAAQAIKRRYAATWPPGWPISPGTGPRSRSLASGSMPSSGPSGPGTKRCGAWLTRKGPACFRWRWISATRIWAKSNAAAC